MATTSFQKDFIFDKTQGSILAKLLNSNSEMIKISSKNKNKVEKIDLKSIKLITNVK